MDASEQSTHKPLSGLLQVSTIKRTALHSTPAPGPSALTEQRSRRLNTQSTSISSPLQQHQHQRTKHSKKDVPSAEDLRATSSGSSAASSRACCCSRCSASSARRSVVRHTAGDRGEPIGSTKSAATMALRLRARIGSCGPLGVASVAVEVDAEAGRGESGMWKPMAELEVRYRRGAVGALLSTGEIGQCAGPGRSGASPEPQPPVDPPLAPCRRIALVIRSVR